MRKENNLVFSVRPKTTTSARNKTRVRTKRSEPPSIHIVTPSIPMTGTHNKTPGVCCYRLPVPYWECTDHKTQKPQTAKFTGPFVEPQARHPHARKKQLTLYKIPHGLQPVPKPKYPLFGRQKAAASTARPLSRPLHPRSAVMHHLCLRSLRRIAVQSPFPSAPRDVVNPVS